MYNAHVIICRKRHSNDAMVTAWDDGKGRIIMTILTTVIQVMEILNYKITTQIDLGGEQKSQAFRSLLLLIV